MELKTISTDKFKGDHKAPTATYTSYSTAIANNTKFLRYMLNNANISNNYLRPYVDHSSILSIDTDGNLIKTPNSRFVSFYKNSSVNVDSNFGISLLVPLDNGFLIHGCGGLAHEALLLVSNDKSFIEKLPKIKNIPPKMYRYGAFTIFIQYSNGFAIKINLSGSNPDVISDVNVYEGESYKLSRYLINDSNCQIFNNISSSNGYKMCILNEHTSITGTYGIVHRGPAVYNEYRSYYESIINKFIENKKNNTFIIEYSGIAELIIRKLHNLDTQSSNEFSINNGLITYTDNSDGNRSNYELLTYEEVYSIFDDQLDKVNSTDNLEPLANFINTVNSDRHDLLHFVTINKSLDNDLYSKEVEISENIFDHGFIEIPNYKECLSYNMAINHELNALEAMTELFNNYVYSKQNSTENPDKYQWMFCDNAVLLLEQDTKYWYINVIKYSDRYGNNQFRQVIKKDQINNLIVSYSTDILTIKFSDNLTTNYNKPSIVRMYDLNSAKPHVPIYGADEKYEFNRHTNNNIIRDYYNIESSYYSNGMLFKTESDYNYASIEYNDFNDIPDIIYSTGEKLNRILFNSSHNLLLKT